LTTLQNSDLRPMLGLVRAPTLVIAGQYDRVTLPAASRALSEALPDARYVEFRRAAHAPFLSHAREFVTVLTDFLPSAPSGQHAADPSGQSTADRAGAGGPGKQTSAQAAPPEVARKHVESTSS
jgi:hypothetical protein